MTTKCPSCGWEQEEGIECIACGIVYSKFRPRAPMPTPAPTGPRAEAVPLSGAGAETSQREDPWPELKAGEVGPPAGDLFDPDAAPPPPPASTERIGGIRAIRVMPRIGPLDTILQALEAIFQRPVWFGSLLLLQWGFLWIVSVARSTPELVAVALSGLLLVGVLATATMVGFRAADRGLPLGVRDVLQVVGRAPRYLWTMFVWGLLMLLLVAVPVIASAFLLGRLLGLLVGIGWVVAGIVAGTAIWGACGPAAVDERLGPLRALGRSRRLTEGSRWAIVGSQLLLGLAGVALRSLPSVGALAHVGRFLVVFHSLVGTTWWAVLYYRLRSLAEGVPMDELDSSLDVAWQLEPESGIKG